MSVRLHITPVYQVKYGNTISSQLTDDIIDLVKDSIYNNGSGYISEDECELEIDKEELKDIRNSRMSLELQMAIDQILQESDPNNNFIHLSLF